MKRKFVLIKLDETKYWNKGTVLVKVGRIFGLYAADLSSITHCCELTPSYELNFVKSECKCDYTDEVDWELIDDYIITGNAERELVSYVHCSSINALPVLDPQSFPPKGSAGATIELNYCDDEDTIDDVIEYIHANGG